MGGSSSRLPFREHVRGTDLILRLAAIQPGWVSVGFSWSAEPSVAERAAEALLQREPQLRITGTHAGQAGPEGDADSLAAINAAGGAEIILVAYGAPSQERWMARNLDAAQDPGWDRGGRRVQLPGRCGPTARRLVAERWSSSGCTVWSPNHGAGAASSRCRDSSLRVLFGRYWPGGAGAGGLDPAAMQQTGPRERCPH